MISNQVDPVARARWEVLGLFADDGAAQRATAWARGVLENASVDPAAQQLRALRALRRADRRLSLSAARYLLSLARGTGGSADDHASSGDSRAATRRRSPLLE